MKKLLLILPLLFFLNSAFSQTNFVWDSVYTSKSTKDQLFSKAKLAIAEVYRSANSVIQNSDQEAGIILLKGSVVLNRKENLGAISITHVFSYTLKVMVRENRYRVMIDNVYNSEIHDNATMSHYIIIPVEDESNQYRMSKKGYLISNKKHAILMSQLKTDLQAVFNQIPIEMNKDLIDDSNW